MIILPLTGSIHSARPARENPRGEGVARIDEGTVLFDVAAYWHLLVRNRLLIGGTILAAMAISVVITLLSTPLYSATTTIQIDREAARVLKAEDTQSEAFIPGQEFILTQYGLLKARSLAERVARSEGFLSTDSFLKAMGVEFKPIAGETNSQTAARRADLVIFTIQSNLGISPVSGSRLVDISFKSPNPDLSAQIANSFARNFIQANLERKFNSTSYARTFLEERIAQTKAKLEETERQLVQYAMDQQIINIDSDSPGGAPQALATRSLVTMNSAFASATSARINAEQRWRRASSTPLMTIVEVQQNPAIQKLGEEKAKLSAEYEQNLEIYQPGFPSMVQLKSRIDELDGQIDQLAREIQASIHSQYIVALNQELALKNEVNGLESDVLNVRERSIQYDILQRELDTTRTLYDGLLQRYKEVSVTDGVTTNNVSVIDEANPPSSPSSPILLLNVAIGALFGFALGLLTAVLLAALDEGVATPEDVETKLGLSVLGAIPLLSKDVEPVAAAADPKSAFSEAYASLGTTLQFSTAEGTPRSILVTSARPAEGKSTTSILLARHLARIGKRVLLIDGDLRNPSLHRSMGTRNERGMSNYLSGSAELADVIHPTSLPRLQFVSSGPLPVNPAELWSGNGLERLLNDATLQVDNIIIDGPPVLGFADAPLLASKVQGTVFVLESKGTKRGQARGALARLTVGAAKILGVVLTKFDAKSASYSGYDYAYDYHYGPNEESIRSTNSRSPSEAG